MKFYVMDKETGEITREPSGDRVVRIEPQSRNPEPPPGVCVPALDPNGPPGIAHKDGQPILPTLTPRHTDPVDAKPAKRGPGRPRGSPNRTKAT